MLTFHTGCLRPCGATCRLRPCGATCRLRPCGATCRSRPCGATSERPARTIALIGFCVLASSLASAQPRVEVHGAAAPASLAASLTDALSDVQEEGTLRVEIEDGAAILRYEPSEGEARTRTLPFDPEAEDAVVALTLVGQNLVRDQTRALILDATPSAALGAPSETPPASVGSPSREEDVPIEDVSPEETAAVEENLALAHPLHFGAAGFFGIHVNELGVVPFGTYGLSLSGTVHRILSVGVTRLTIMPTYSSIDGAGVAIEGTPFLEVFGYVDPRVQIYGQLGAALQGRTQSTLREDPFQVALFVSAGARFWFEDFFSVGVELAGHLVLTNGYQTFGVSLPQLAVPATLGVSLEWHITP